MPATSLDQIVALSKRRGFVFQTSEIYGGLANVYDYGPLGVELANNIRSLWWKAFISDRDDMVGLDSSILQHPQTWVASGHVDALTDPLVEDLISHKRYRADHLIESWLQKNAPDSDVVVEDMTTRQMGEFIEKHHILSPEGNELSAPKDFNLLFETKLGTVSGEKSTAYLRGETAQGIFANFKQVLDSSRIQLPFGIGQLGTSFRNEITTGQFIFRTLEFRQAEIEYFFDPEVNNWRELFEDWQSAMWNFVVDELGINKEHIRWRKHTDSERSHYSKETFDLDYKFPFGWKELWGIAYRTDFDIKQHMEHSGKKLFYTDPNSGKKVIPHVIEPAGGLDRFILMVLADAYWEDDENHRTVLKLDPKIAPYKAAVFPLLKNKPELVSLAKKVYQSLKKDHNVTWDDRGNIGKRYLYQDEIGTPHCITVDFDSISDDMVTVRNRDTTAQERVNISKLSDYLFEKSTT